MNLIRLRYTRWFNILRDGISRKNPIVVTVLGICSSLAITNKVENAITMGLGVTFVTMMSSAVIAAIRNIIPSKVRMIAYMVIISTLTIAFQLVLAAYLPAINKALGAYVGLIITNCIVMGRAEAFAVKNPVRYSLIDGFASGMGYTFVLLMASVIREILAFGTLFNIQIMPDAFPTWAVMALAPGGFFVISLFVWGIRELIRYYESPEGDAD